MPTNLQQENKTQVGLVYLILKDKIPNQQYQRSQYLLLYIYMGFEQANDKKNKYI